MQQRLELAQQRAHAAGRAKVFHIAVADRLEIDQHGRRIRQRIEMIERNFYAGAAGDRGQMNDRIGRAAEREQHAQRVLDRFRVDQLRWLKFRADQLDRRGAGRLGGAQAIRVHGRDRRGAGQADAERFGEAGHGRGGAHHRAGAGGHRELAFDLGDFVGIDVAGAIARPEAAAIGAGAEPLAAVPAGHHRAGDQRDGGPVGGHRAHQLRRHGLVAAAHQHHRIHRLRADHFLGVDRHQVAVFEAGRREEHFAERNGREFQRQRAGGEHAAFHRRQQLGEMAVAIVEVRSGVSNADHRLVEHRARIAHGLRERAAQVAGEIAVAVIGEAVV